MLGNLSGGELLILLVIVLLVFGANRLPEAARAMGKGMREFRRALEDARDAAADPESRAPTARPPAQPPRRLID